jgi:glycosyltransferase involved in cell wall biosynthesis
MDNAVGWISSAERACEMLNARDVDVVLASGPAFSAFSAAQRLGRRLRCPYVLDYRDLWSRNLHRPVPAAVRTEASLLAGSAAVTTVSPSWRTVLDQDFGVRAKSHVVSNGYDPESLADVRPQKFDHFAIVYTGTLWPPKRPITPLMAALTRLEQIANDRQKCWMFHYYGRSEQHVREEAERFGISRRVVVHGEVTRGMALSAVKGCGVAVVITSVADAAERADNGMVTGKIFETVGLGTPILLIAPTTSDANAVIQTAGVGQGIPANDTDGIALFLRGLMDGTVPPVKDPAAYSWASIVGVLSSILHGVIAR